MRGKLGIYRCHVGPVSRGTTYCGPFVCSVTLLVVISQSGTEEWVCGTCGWTIHMVSGEPLDIACLYYLLVSTFIACCYRAGELITAYTLLNTDTASGITIHYTQCTFFASPF